MVKLEVERARHGVLDGDRKYSGEKEAGATDDFSQGDNPERQQDF